MSKKKNDQNGLAKKENKTSDNVLKIIVWIEQNEDRLFKSTDCLGGTSRSTIIVLAAILCAIFIVNFTVPDFINRMMLGFTSVAVLIAFISLSMQMGEKGILEKRFGRAKKLGVFNEKDQAVLYALIKLKNANEEIDLKTLYALDKETKGILFTEKKLLEMVCRTT